MILFVDDDIERHIEFRRQQGDNKKGLFQTASTFVAFTELSQSYSDITEVWLDHDLGYALNPQQQVFEPNGNDVDVVDIMPLVRWMCSEGCQLPKATYIRIHSWNSPAAARMLRALCDAGFTNVETRPFKFA